MHTRAVKGNPKILIRNVSLGTEAKYQKQENENGKLGKKNRIENNWKENDQDQSLGTQSEKQNWDRMETQSIADNLPLTIFQKSKIENWFEEGACLKTV